MKFYKHCVSAFISFILILYVCPQNVYGITSSQTHDKTTLEITAPSAVLIDASTGVVIYDKNKDEKNFPASITKIMTALIVLEKYEGNLNEKVLFSENAVHSIPYASSHIAMNDGETLTLEQSLYAILLASANEVSNAVSELVSGNNKSFGELMTRKAIEIGAINTRFVNPHGLHDENHFTTAYDMALITKEAIKHPEFVKIISTEHYDIPPTERQSQVRPLNNSHKMMIPASMYHYSEVVGGKTGFTNEALHPLVTYAQRGNMRLIAVVMRDEKAGAYTDTKALLDYGFSQFEEVEIFNKNSFKAAISVSKPSIEGFEKINAVAKNSIKMFLPKNSVGNVSIKENLPKEITASVKSGDKLGTLELTCNNVSLGSVDVVAQTSVNIDNNITNNTKQSFSDDEFSGFFSFRKIIEIVLVLVMVSVCLKAVFVMKTNNRKAYRYSRMKNISSRTPYKYK